MTRSVAFGVLLGVLGLGAASAGCDDGLHPPTQPSPVFGVTAVSPSAGTMLGATPVTISGTGFKTGATVQFGGVAAPVSDVSSTRITANAPAHADGSVTVVVTNPG